MIRPTNPRAISVPQGSTSGMGMNNGGYAQPQQQVSQADMIRNFVAGGIQNQMRNGNQPGGITWQEFDGHGVYNDEVLNSFRANDAKENVDRRRFFLEKIAPGIKMFIDQINYKSGGMYTEVVKAKENFKISSGGFPCKVKTAFIEAISKRYELNRILAFNGAPFFANALVSNMEGGVEQLSQGHYFEAINVAVRNVLYFEMISWLMFSRTGRAFSLSLPDDIMTSVGNLTQFKELSERVCEELGVPFPYSNLEFKVPTSVRQEFSAQAQTVTDFFVGDTPDGFARQEVTQGYVNDAQKDLNDYIDKMNAMSRQTQQPYSYDQTESQAPDWNNTFNKGREDLENLTPENRVNFNLPDYFTPLGHNNNLYYVNEENWQKVKKGFTLGTGEVDDTSWGDDCFRIVETDMYGDDTSYKSTLVRDKNLSEVDVLTNPKVLLGLYENREEMLTSVINATELKEDKEVFIDIDDVIEEDQNVPFAVLEKEIEVSDLVELNQKVGALAKRLTKDGKSISEFMMGVKTTVIKPYVCKHPVERKALETHFEDLFFETKITKSPLEVCSSLLELFKTDVISGELKNVIDSNLTTRFNRWLVERQGLNPNKGEPGHLSVSSIVRDHLEVSRIIKEHFNDKFHMLAVNYGGNPLLKLMKLFTKEGVPDDELLKDNTVYIKRNIISVYYNGESGPITSNNGRVIVKRSNFPTLMNGLEKGVLKLTGGNDPISGLDVLLKFEKGMMTWRYVPSVFDGNVCNLIEVKDTDLVKLQ